LLSTMPRKKVIIDTAHVMQLKLEGLKKLCAKHKLSKQGRKAELQKRILQHLKLDTTSDEADTDATSSKENEPTANVNQVQELVKEDCNAKERTKRPAQNILNEELDKCSERDHQKLSENGTSKELPHQSDEDLEAHK